MNIFDAEGLKVGVVGATGQVGVAMRQILLEREFPVGEGRGLRRRGMRAGTAPRDPCRQ